MSNNLPLSPATKHSGSLTPIRKCSPTQDLSKLRKAVLLTVFCLSQFLDIFSVASLMAAIPTISDSLKMNSSESTWILSAFQLTFSAFLLVSGKLSDEFNAKHVFVVGISALAVVTLLTGFMENKIAFFVLRAFGGIAGSMTIPSSLKLIVRIFPEPSEQGRAISVYGASGAIGNVTGFVIGALFTQYVSWRWVFWFVSILAIIAGATGAIMIPRQYVPGSERSIATRIRHMDLPGVGVLTVAIILFILALTESTNAGWGSAIVIAPLVISVVFFVAFFCYERCIPQDRAAIPPRTWFYKNFSVLFGTALLPYLWWNTSFFMLTDYWQDVFDWTTIMSAVRMLPISVAGGTIALLSPLAKHLSISVKHVMLVGYAGMITGTVLLTQADLPETYWPYVLPAFVIGSAGTMLTYVFANIGIFRSTPPHSAGTVGAMFNGALQLGSAVGIAAVTSIQLSVQTRTENGAEGYQGRADAFWFVLGAAILATAGVVLFYDASATVDDSPTLSLEGTVSKHKEDRTGDTV